MSRHQYFYLRLPPKELQVLVEDFQTRFDQQLEDTFGDDELSLFEKSLDQMAAIYVQPILSELTFDDFYADPDQEKEQREFFETARSSISVENLPYLESNPFQVSYLKELLAPFDQVLIDRGGVETLQFKNEYVLSLEKYKDMDSLIREDIPVVPKSSKVPVHPMDFLVQDVYHELQVMISQHRTQAVHEELKSLPEKMRKVFEVFQTEGLDAETLMLNSKLIPKDFGDQLERLKFFLRRMNKA